MKYLNPCGDSAIAYLLIAIIVLLSMLTIIRMLRNVNRYINERPSPRPGVFYKHYKGGVYKFILNAESEEFPGKYNSIYQTHTGEFKSRPVENFMGKATLEDGTLVNRFEVILDKSEVELIEKSWNDKLSIIH